MSLRVKIAAAFVSTVLVLVVGVVALVATNTVTETRRAVRSTRATLDSLRAVMVGLVDAETGQRGYLLTNDKRYLAPYRAAIERMPELLRGLERTSYKSGRQWQVPGLKRAVADKLAELQDTIAIYESGRRDTALRIVLTDRGKVAMDRVRQAVRAMEVEEAGFLRTRERKQDRNIAFLNSIVAIGSLSAFLLNFAVVSAIRRGFLDQEQTTRLIAGQRVQLEQQLRETRSLATALARSNKELDQFAYVTSHDLKAPLRGIANLSQWLEEDLGDAVTDNAREQLRLLRGRVHRMEGLIEGILEYSRAGRTPIAREEIDTNDLLDDILELSQFGRDDVRFEIARDLPRLTTERTPFQQVWMNLIGNALRHGNSEAPRVCIGANDAGEYWEFFVADNGPGIPREFHERIFGVFQTLAPRDRVEGTGIGLAIVRKLVEGRGGRIWVESEPGNGATFRFLWPKVEPEENHGNT